MKFLRPVKVLAGRSHRQLAQETIHCSLHRRLRAQYQRNATPDIAGPATQMWINLRFAPLETENRFVPEPVINFPRRLQTVAQDFNSSPTLSIGRPTTLL